jgi:hypothetical protein
VLAVSAIGGKAETYAIASFSAFDPQRTFGLISFEAGGVLIFVRHPVARC